MEVHSPELTSGSFRFLFYSHDGAGLGHIRRNLAVAGALKRRCPRSSILLATGSYEVDRLGLLSNIEALKLPGLQKLSNGHYEARRLGVSATDLFAIRSALLKTAVQAFQPAVMLVDKHPVGVSGELRPALNAFRSLGGRAVLGLRDILDDPATVLEEWRTYRLREQIERLYDEVFIYGDDRIFNPAAAYDFGPTLTNRVRFCGYVLSANQPPPPTLEQLPLLAGRSDGRPVVLATPGGGEDGFDLLKVFIEAAKRAPWKGLVVTGPMVPGRQLELLREMAVKAGVGFRTFVSGLADCFSRMDAVVCMGGYNTVVETVSRGTPVVCVPRTQPRIEQLIRARAFAQLGLLAMIEPGRLSVRRLKDAIATALNQSRRRNIERAASLIDFNGADEAAVCLLRLARMARPVERVSPADPVLS